jgi:site-specific recombinase XerD
MTNARVGTAVESALARMPKYLSGPARPWTWDLQSQDRSPNTVLSYATALVRFGAWLQENATDVHSIEAVTDRHVKGFLASLQKDGGTNSTAVTRYVALQVFFRYLADEQGLPADPTARVRRPASRKPATVVPAEADVTALLATCNGGRTDFVSLRDRAILRLMADCGLRREEVATLRVADLDLTAPLAARVHVVGKGRKERDNYVSSKTRKALYDYTRARESHPYASAEMLWLGAQGRGPINAEAVWRMVGRRARLAGVRNIHPHSFRHLAADGLLAKGVPEGAVMSIMGWSDRRMLDRYGAGNADKRALEAQRRAAHGDRF